MIFQISKLSLHPKFFVKTGKWISEKNTGEGLRSPTSDKTQKAIVKKNRR